MCLCQWEVILSFLMVSCGYLPALGLYTSPTYYEEPYLSRIETFPISSDFSEKEGLDQLLNYSRYDNRSIPPTYDPLNVSVSVLFITLTSPDESSLKYEVEFLVTMVWTDNRLRYAITTNSTLPLPTSNEPYNYDAMPMRLNRKKRDYLDGLHHHERVWKPDVYYVKHGDFRAGLDPLHLALRIFPNGTIFFVTRKYLILSCEGYFPFFPFDSPICRFSIESVSYERDRLLFHWETQAGVLRKSPGLSNVNAYIESNATNDNCSSKHDRGDFSCLEVVLIFGRDRAFYFTTVFVPDIILVTSSMITFYLEWDAVPARILLGVTTLLTLFTTSNSFRGTLPVVSNLTAMNIWDGFSMFFIYASLLEFVLVNYIGRLTPRRIPIKSNNDKIDGQSEMEALANAPSSPVFGDSSSSPTSNKQSSTEQMMVHTTTTCNKSTSNHHINNSCFASIQRHSFLQRMGENPVAVAKTIDYVSRIAFPVAYAIFLIFFFVRHLALRKHKY